MTEPKKKAAVRKSPKTKGRTSHFRIMLPAGVKDRIARDAYAAGLALPDYIAMICKERAGSVVLSEHNAAQVEGYAKQENRTRDDVVNRMLDRLRFMDQNPGATEFRQD